MASNSTPSPRRFLASKPHPRPPLPSSSLRNQTTSSSQFAATPRFNVSASKKNANIAEPIAELDSSPLVRRTRQPVASHRGNKDDILDDERDTSGEFEADEDITILETVETGDGSDPDDILPPPKRRRLTPTSPPRQGHIIPSKRNADPILISSSPPPSPPSPLSPPNPTTPTRRLPYQTSPPTTTATRGYPHTAPRYRFSSTTTDRQDAFRTPSRPTFILPADTSPALHSDTDLYSILPAVLSPHKKGRHFVINGMAETVRDWIVDLSSSATGLNSNRWVKKGKVKEVSGGAGEAGFMLVECIVNGSARENMRQDTKDITELEPMAEKWILTGSSIDTPIRPRSRQGAVQATSPVQVGDTVGVKEPTWIVDLQGTATHVFVNWAVLKDT